MFRHTQNQNLRAEGQTKAGRLDIQMKLLKDRAADGESLRKERERLAKRRVLLQDIRGLFKAKGFVNYVSTVYLRDLCARANDRFRVLTNQSLALELDESNDFVIRDYLNGGKVRSVRTLSGGQTFQASFSLALALADSVARGEAGFFFLDEGFGSLDKESLRLVFEGLKMLRKENRIVGVISHVEELKQEIDLYLTVENHPETGSSISFLDG